MRIHSDLSGCATCTGPGSQGQREAAEHCTARPGGEDTGGRGPLGAPVRGSRAGAAAVAGGHSGRSKRHRPGLIGLISPPVIYSVSLNHSLPFLAAAVKYKPSQLHLPTGSLAQDPGLVKLF